MIPIAAAVLLALNPTQAQDEKRRPERPGGEQPDRARRPGADRPEGERPPGGRPEGGPRGGGDLLGLNEEQRDLLRQANEEHRGEMTGVMEKMRDARRGLNEAILAERLDLAAVKKQAREVAEIQAELSVIQAKVFSKVRSKLSAEQVERLKNVPLDMMMRGGLGGGPGGPGGFRPGGPDGQRPDGQRYNPDNPQRRTRGDAPGDERPRRPAPESEPK